MSSRFWTGVYLIVIVWPLPGYLDGDPDPTEAVLVAAGVIAFVVLYLRVVWTALRRMHENATPVAFVLFWLVAMALAIPLGPYWLFAATFFVIGAQAVSFETRGVFAWVTVTIITITALILILGLPFSGYWWIPGLALLFAGAMHNFLNLRRANLALTDARRHAERLAVDNERLRFARDLHDILGHSLSVMTLKSQLATRLVELDPERARSEIEEVERMSRHALSELRDVVVGYRRLSLDDEVANAERALAAAGIGLDVTRDPVPPEAASLFAWVVREGATNVVRHSLATHCHIRLGAEAGNAYVEVLDNGTGTGPETTGGGLRGLSERVEAAGGTLCCLRVPEGGFSLRAIFPLEVLS